MFALQYINASCLLSFLLLTVSSFYARTGTYNYESQSNDSQYLFYGQLSGYVTYCTANKQNRSQYQQHFAYFSFIHFMLTTTLLVAYFPDSNTG